MKINIFPISIFILLIMPFWAAAQEPHWLVKLKQQKWFGKVSQIKLLKTSRAEVESILGKPESDSYDIYSLERVILLIWIIPIKFAVPQMAKLIKIRSKR